MVEIQVAVSWSSDVPDETLAGLLTRSVRAAVHVGSATSPWPLPPEPARLDVSLHLTDDAEMQRLNCMHRGVDRTTDVLSFSLVEHVSVPEAAPPSDLPISLGDVVLSLPYAERQAADIGHSVETELAWLTIHGTLQLLGYVHDTEESASAMEALEQEALAELGL